MYESQLLITSTKAKQLAKRLKSKFQLETLSEAQEAVAALLGCPDFNTLLAKTGKAQLPTDQRRAKIDSLVDELVAQIYLSGSEAIETHATVHNLIAQAFNGQSEQLAKDIFEEFPHFLANDVPECWIGFNRCREQSLGMAAGILEVLVYRKMDRPICKHQFEPTDTSGHCLQCSSCGWTWSIFDAPFNHPTY